MRPRLAELHRCPRNAAEESRLRLSLGLHRLDFMNDPKAAAAEFDAVMRPPPATHRPTEADPWLISRDAWVRAQLGLARCELRQGCPAAADARYAEMRAGVPELKKYFTECDRFEAERGDSK
jgi:hypothetical protein